MQTHGSNVLKIVNEGLNHDRLLLRLNPFEYTLYRFQENRHLSKKAIAE